MINIPSLDMYRTGLLSSSHTGAVLHICVASARCSACTANLVWLGVRTVRTIRTRSTSPTRRASWRIETSWRVHQLVSLERLLLRLPRASHEKRGSCRSSCRCSAFRTCAGSSDARFDRGLKMMLATILGLVQQAASVKRGTQLRREHNGTFLEQLHNSVRFCALTPANVVDSFLVAFRRPEQSANTRRRRLASLSRNFMRGA